MSPKGRHAKGKARINAYEAMLSHESEKRAPELEIYIPAGPVWARRSSKPWASARPSATRN